MKKLLITLMLTVPLLTGCANVDTMVTLNDNKSATVVSSLTYRGDLMDKTDSDAASILENYQNFLEPSYKVETEYGAKLSTVTAIKSVKNLSHNDLDLASLGFVSNRPNKRFIDIKKNFFITSYIIDITYDLNAQKAHLKEVSENKAKQIEQSVLQPEYYQKYGDKSELEAPPTSDESLFFENLDEDTLAFVKKTLAENRKSEVKPGDKNLEVSFSVKVPTIASYNNADSVNGNVYVWNLNPDEPTIIRLNYIRYGTLPIVAVLLLGVVLLVFVARKIIARDTQKRMDNNDNIV